MDKQYSHDKKQKLADRITTIHKKEYMIKIYEIIKEDNIQISENNNGLFMFFHKLSDQTYYKIEQYLKQISKKGEECPDKINEYVPYACDDFPEQIHLTPKLKYSNKEKNIIKRQRYDAYINNNDGAYQKFNVNTLSDSTKKTSSSDLMVNITVKPKRGRKPTANTLELA